jgi:mRNA-degrading endonuclease RelE of RelBE toxin-antitoxin system
MKSIIRVSKSFKRQAKPLLKKYSSLKDEFIELERKLQENPKLGTPLGQNACKIRLAVKSKRKGKSGGLRVITHIDTEIVGLIEKYNEITIVTLISIYDKSETATISNNELKDLIIALQNE